MKELPKLREAMASAEARLTDIRGKLTERRRESGLLAAEVSHMQVQRRTALTGDGDPTPLALAVVDRERAQAALVGIVEDLSALETDAVAEIRAIERQLTDAVRQARWERFDSLSREIIRHLNGRLPELMRLALDLDRPWTGPLDALRHLNREDGAAWSDWRRLPPEDDLLAAPCRSSLL